jgi:hypothetical protein
MPPSPRQSDYSNGCTAAPKKLRPTGVRVGCTDVGDGDGDGDGDAEGNGDVDGGDAGTSSDCAARACSRMPRAACGSGAAARHGTAAAAVTNWRAVARLRTLIAARCILEVGKGAPHTGHHEGLVGKCGQKLDDGISKSVIECDGV